MLRETRYTILGPGVRTIPSAIAATPSTAVESIMSVTIPPRRLAVTVQSGLGGPASGLHSSTTSGNVGRVKRCPIRKGETRVMRLAVADNYPTRDRNECTMTVRQDPVTWFDPKRGDTRSGPLTANQIADYDARGYHSADAIIP